MEVFITQFYGDLPTKYPQDCKNLIASPSLDDAIAGLHKMFPAIEQPAGIAEDLGEKWVDPEDDRIVIWKADSDTGKVTVAWHFSGWHWSVDASDLLGGPLDQGCLLGYNKSVYEMLMEDY